MILSRRLKNKMAKALHLLADVITLLEVGLRLCAIWMAGLFGLNPDRGNLPWRIHHHGSYRHADERHSGSLDKNISVISKAAEYPSR